MELDVRQQVEPHRPTIMSSLSVACGLMRVQMSMVNSVLLLLKMEAKEDMRAASITANISPRSPAQTDIRKEGEWAQEESRLFRERQCGSVPFGISDTTNLG